MKFGSWKTALGTLALGALIALGTSAPAEAKGNLIVKRFLTGRLDRGQSERFTATGSRGTDNAFRDNVIMLVFTAPVSFESVNNRTVKIGIPAGGNLFIDAEGRFLRYTIKQYNNTSGSWEIKRAYKNRILFDPTDGNPFGFEANSKYTVTVPGLDEGSTKVVRSTKGNYCERTFTTSFTTTSDYLQDYKQPSIDKIYGSDATTIDLDGRSNVDSRADIVAEFSEPMLPSAFDPATTFQVYNFGQARTVTGTIRPSVDGKLFTFRPAFGYGRGPYNIRVTLSGTLTDLSGNKLAKGRVVNFVTEFDPFAPNYEEIVETFDTNSFEDTNYQNANDPATWNGGKTAGTLIGTFNSKSLDILVTVANNGDSIPFWYRQAHSQNLYSAAQMGSTPRTLSGFSWRHYIMGYATYTTYPNMTVQMGHNTSGNLNSNYTGSFSDTPVVVFNSSTYTVPTSVPEWIAGPTWTGNWAYNGKDGVVLDVNNPNGSTSQVVNYWRYNTTAQGGITKIRGYVDGAGVTWLLATTWGNDIRIHYLVDKSEAQSLWYDTDQNSPGFLDPIVTQVLPPGTVASVLFQGARENPLLPGTPDTTAVTGWTADPFNDLGGHRFVRFHVDMTSNLGTSTRPVIDEIKLPFIFF